MAKNNQKPYTPSRRYMTFSDFSDITKKTPERKLIKPLKKTGGRNNSGRITMRRRGGGHKRKYRIIDFKRNKYDVQASVIAIEYDPNRTSRIALLEYEDKEKRYIVSASGMKVGDKIISSRNKKVPVKIVTSEVPEDLMAATEDYIPTEVEGFPSRRRAYDANKK